MANVQNQTCSPAELEAHYVALAQQLRPAYVYLLMPIVLTSLLVPFLCALFYFSTSRQRRSFMFVWVVLSLISAMSAYLLQSSQELKLLQNPYETSRIFTPGAICALGLLFGLPNFFADLALFCRMLVVYPYATTRRLHYFAIFTPSICIKVARAASMIVARIFALQQSPRVASFAWSQANRDWVIVTVVMAAVDNGYSSAFFLWKLRGVVLQKETPEFLTPSVGGKTTTTHRIRTLFWLAMSSFLLPLPLLFISVGLAASSLNQSTAFSVVQYLTSFLSAVCVAFATVWASRTHGSDETVSNVTTLRFRPPTPSYLRSSVEIGPGEISMTKMHSNRTVPRDWKPQSV